MSTTYDLAVIGGGVHGSTCALFAARGGMKVALIERGPLCREASGVNAGTLTMQMTRVALIPYALRAHAMWANASEWLGHDVGVVVCDGLSLAFTEQEEELLSFRAGKRREAGAPIELISGADALRVEPGISDKVRLAGYCKVDGYANAYLTGLAFRRALLGAGVDLMENTPASGIDREESGFAVKTATGVVRAKRVVLAGGVWIEPMLGWLGIDLPIKTLINQLVVTERVRPVMRTVVGIANGLLSLKQYPHGTVVIGGGWQGIGDRERGGVELMPDRIVGNVRLACHAIPELKDARVARAWAGLEAETADALPAAGPIPGIPDAYVCGSVHSGYTSGPYIARLLADRILGHEPALPLFPIDRLLNSGDAERGPQ
ncbi:sarcosine oxidase subunit beta [Azorhizobium oxalatiphilum]|uniref:Sarcosine oxidase subunit beta n=1 Tax=Azorhizobium oxalatiphilum TaxID=980631 RepID=A0A917CIT8_9HYPH|nr:FAD-binding oxidoreductase [Azorhizobium oxalatiphilum]GGF89754.1 sarcosine oxidase subunit beta [Azorhizobium oxalatiphilum]